MRVDSRAHEGLKLNASDSNGINLPKPYERDTAVIQYHELLAHSGPPLPDAAHGKAVQVDIRLTLR